MTPKLVPSPKSNLSGECPTLSGDCTGLSGDCTGLSGDCSNLWGDCSTLRGDIDACGLTPEDRSSAVDIKTLVAP